MTDYSTSEVEVMYRVLKLQGLHSYVCVQVHAYMYVCVRVYAQVCGMHVCMCICL